VRPNSELCGENKQKPRQKAKAIFQEKMNGFPLAAASSSLSE